jgi:hypothetical protein
MCTIDTVEELSASQRDELVENYWRYYHFFTSENRDVRLRAQEFAWARDFVDDAVHRASSDVVPILVALSLGAKSDGELAFLGAGPVEDLLKSGGEERTKELADAVRQNPTLALAREHAWDL